MQYTDFVILEACPEISSSFLETHSISIVVDPYGSSHPRFDECKSRGAYVSFDPPMARVSNSSVVDRILANHSLYTERNRRKLGKSEVESRKKDGASSATI